jgi:glycosyltransferase involved in cell wall biosynthesis
MKLSVVIPTRNRPASLHRLLESLGRQAPSPDEVIVVDASDAPPPPGEIQRRHPRLNLCHLTSVPSVCLQRNLGVRRARGELVFLCDDDMEVPEDYLASLVRYLELHPAEGAVSGIVIDRGPSGAEHWEYPVKSLGNLCFRFLFQLPIWGSIDGIEPGPLGQIPYSLLKNYYARRGNDVSAAGWPVVTCFRRPSFRTRVWGLGASVIRRDWLGASPYDELLDAHGIGDNYDLSLRLPGGQPIVVLTEVRIYHHKDGVNRLPPALTFFRRTLALHYFLVKHRCFSRWNRCAFLWSLLGKLAESMYAGDAATARAVLAVFGAVTAARNPYVTAYRQGGAFAVTPLPGRAARPGGARPLPRTCRHARGSSYP